MATDEEIKKIIDDTLIAHYKKRNYQWTKNHPGIVENLAVIFGAVTCILILITSGFWAIAYDNLEDFKSFEQTVIKDSSCQQLKTYLHDLNSQSNSLGTGLIKDEITSRC